MSSQFTVEALDLRIAVCGSGYTLKVEWSVMSQQACSSIQRSRSTSVVGPSIVRVRVHRTRVVRQLNGYVSRVTGRHGVEGI